MFEYSSLTLDRWEVKFTAGGGGLILHNQINTITRYDRQRQVKEFPGTAMERAHFMREGQWRSSG